MFYHVDDGRPCLTMLEHRDINHGWTYSTIVDHGWQWLIKVDKGWWGWPCAVMVDHGWPWLINVDHGQAYIYLNFNVTSLLKNGYINRWSWLTMVNNGWHWLNKVDHVWPWLRQSLSQCDVETWLTMVYFHIETMFVLMPHWLIFILIKYLSQCDVGPWLIMIINPKEIIKPKYYYYKYYE